MPEGFPPGQRRALIIATDEYEDPELTRLRSPVHDVRDLARILGDQAIGAFEVRTVRNKATHPLRQEIHSFFQSASGADLLFFHLSCHGLKDDYGDLYFATVDTTLAGLEATALESTWLRKQIDRSRSRRVVVQLDCCYSGAFTNASTHRAAGDAVDVPGYLTPERPSGSGRVVLTASRAMEYAFEGGELSGRGEASVFTRAVAEGLETGDADLNGDGWVSVDELYDYVFEAVRARTAKQTPGIWADVRGDIHIARSPRGPREVASTQPQLPADVLAAIDNPRASVRAGAVGDLAELLDRPREEIATLARARLVELSNDRSPMVAAAARAALGGRRFTMVGASRATKVGVALALLGALVMLIASVMPVYADAADVLGETIYAPQTVGVPIAVTGVVLAFLARRSSVQFLTGFLVGAGLATGVGATIALAEIKQQDLNPPNMVSDAAGQWWPPESTSFCEGGCLHLSRGSFATWLIGAALVAAAGVVFAELAFGVKAFSDSGRPSRGWIADLAILVVVLSGGAAVIGGVALAPEAFLLDLRGVRYGIGGLDALQPIVLTAALIALVALRWRLRAGLRPFTDGITLSIALVIFLYLYGVANAHFALRDVSDALAVALGGSLLILVGILLAATLERVRRLRVAGPPSPA